MSTNPFLILGVATDATDQTIRQKYLAAIQHASPESRPDEFQALTHAYELISTEHARHSYLLFNRTAHGHSPVDALVQAAAATVPRQPLSFEQLKAYLRAAAKNSHA